MPRKSTHRPARLQKASFEALETRRLLSTMTVNGTANADVINLDVGGGLVTVTVNGGSPQVTTDALTTDVTINGLGGADTININENGNNAVTVNGGTENDTINIAATSHVLDDITDLITVNGDLGSDTTSFHDESHTGTTSYDFTAGTKLARTGMSQVTFNTEQVSLGSGSGADTFNVKGALAATLNVDGNAGSDFLDLISTINENATVSPSGSVVGAGTATFGAQAINYTDMLRVIAGDLGSLTIVTPSATDAFSVSDLGSSTAISGTSGGFTVTPVVFSGTTTVTLDMAANDAGAGNDVLSLTGSTQGTNLLRVINGTGDNTMNVAAGSYDLDVDLGATLGNSTDITVDAGAVTFNTQQNIRSLTLKNAATIDFSGGTGSMLVLQSLSVPAGSATINTILNQSGNVTNTFAIGANSTLFKGGAGGLALGGVQTHGNGATLSVTDGTCNVTTDAGSAASRTLNLIADGTFVSLFSTQHLNSVFAFDGGTIAVQPNGNRVLVVNSVLTDVDLGPGKINLTNNDMIVDYTNASEATAIRSLLHNGRNLGDWNGNGISSSNAGFAPHNTTLGSMEATEFKSVYGAGATFDAQAIDNTAVLIKYTYYGDADFNGIVNFDDYSRTDNGFTNHRSGWLNGDFDDNGVVNFDDYSLIDLAFNTQGPTLRPAAGRPTPVRAPAKLPSLI